MSAEREPTDRELLEALVKAWDKYLLGEVSRLMQMARERLGLTLPSRNKDRT